MAAKYSEWRISNMLTNTHPLAALARLVFDEAGALIYYFTQKGAFMRQVSSIEALNVVGGLLYSDDPMMCLPGDPFSPPGSAPDSWYVNYTNGYATLITDTQCVPLNPDVVSGYSTSMMSYLNSMFDSAVKWVTDNCSVNVNGSLGINGPDINIEVSCKALGK